MVSLEKYVPLACRAERHLTSCFLKFRPVVHSLGWPGAGLPKMDITGYYSLTGLRGLSCKTLFLHQWYNLFSFFLQAKGCVIGHPHPKPTRWQFNTSIWQDPNLQDREGGVGGGGGGRWGTHPLRYKHTSVDTSRLHPRCKGSIRFCTPRTP